MRYLPLLFLGCACLQAANPPAQFKTHTIEADYPGGYTVIVVDVNNDGLLDVIGMSQRVNEQAWYENPTWERHVMFSGLSRMVNLAAHDVDGDGIPEVALQSEFSMDATKSPGLVWVAEHQGDPKGPWKLHKVDELITSHHIAWADVDGDGTVELINAPLIAPTAVAPKYEGMTEFVYYRVPKNLDGPWVRKHIDDISGVIHRVRVVKWVPGARDEIMTTSFEGVKLHTAHGEGDNITWDNKLIVKGHEEEAPRAGTSDMKLAQFNGKRFLAAVEPWHGNEVVTYTQNGAGWDRHVLFDGLAEGHEVCVGDFNGDGLDDIVAGDRAKGKVSSSHLFYAQDASGTNWDHVILDEMGMSASGCQTADINKDGRMDIVMIGGGTHNIKFYENLGVK